MMRMDWLTEMTGKPDCLATRSAVRCRVPDSSDGIDGSGIRCTAARTMRVPSLDSTTAPSILHSSRRRVAENSTSSGKPPVQMLSTTESYPSTISAPVRPRRIRSSPSRSAVPGAINARLARNGSPLTPPPVRPAAAGLIARGDEPFTLPRGGGVAAAPGLEASRSSGTCTFYGLGSTATRPVPFLFRSVTVSLRRRPPRPLQRRAEIRYLDHLHAGWHVVVAAGAAMGRHEREPESEPGRLGQPAADRADPAHLSGEPHLA